MSDESKELVATVVEKVSQIVSEMAGIQLGARQVAMVENRLRSRMVRLGIDGFSHYLEYLTHHLEQESQALLSLMTTHHTYFFREFAHFEHLISTGLPAAIEAARARPDKQIRVWSAACSRGQEVYSLAMFLNVHLKQLAPELSFKIWGTDIDPESVKHAKNGVYRVEEVRTSPAIYVSNHWIRGQGEVSDFSKVRDDLRHHCEFLPLNLLDPNSFLAGKEFDIIFCRNVFIYFKQMQIKQVTKQMINHLHPSGFLYLGISESLNGLGLPLNLAGSSIYCHKVAGESAPSINFLVPASRTRDRKEISVLAVDDSPTILALLKKILVQDHGFKVGATAKNGREALNILAKNKFDIVLLDLHMPELDGVGFLKEFNDPNTPVVIVSAINRDDPTMAQTALKLGAIDYVEKPSLENLVEAGDELRSKIKTILSLRDAKAQKSMAVPQRVALPKANSFTKLAPRKVVTPEPKIVSPVMTKKVKVLIVDDSATIRHLLGQLISKDPNLEVIGAIGRPSEVEAAIKANRPDVITMDVNMPEMDGVTLLQKLHPVYGIPTVMITSISKEEGPQILKALEIGAVDYIQKPEFNDLKEAADRICESLKTAAKANLVKNQKRRKVLRKTAYGDELSLIVMGASTGGTEALRHVLESLPDQIPPILIVQHIPPVFSEAFAARLNSYCPFEVREAADGDEVKPNLVLIAPGGKQMGITQSGSGIKVVINDDPLMNRHRPSVDYLFKSVADNRIGNVVGVILTGMGADGARQMKVLRDAGARTIGQDEETSVVYGMPKEAAKMGGVEYQLPLDDIAEKIVELVEEKSKGRTAKVS